MLDFGRIKTYPISQRKNLVKLEDLIDPEAPPPYFESQELKEVAKTIVEARRKGRPVLWMMGAHVIKCGLGPVLIDLMERGVVSHVASNGAASIHDFEIALIGETSEDVATSIEDGTFGMAEETGLLMNIAIQRGVRDGLGYGESLGRMISEDNRFKFKKYSVLYHAYRLGIPFTVHVALGTDIIHQHPACDFSAIGEASGIDFKKYVYTVSRLDEGVFLNFGSAVIGPEVFLKALSIARNLGFKVERFTAANFDLKLIRDYTRPRKKDEEEYYYRPLKNIVIRPTSLGGKGFHITGDHAVTIPNLRHLVVMMLKEEGVTLNPPEGTSKFQQKTEGLLYDAPLRNIVEEFARSNQELSVVVVDMVRTFRLIDLCLRTGGTLFLCGNGGSFADAFHISAELLKSFEFKRPIPAYRKKLFEKIPYGEILGESLEEGLRVIVLGSNHSLSSAVENDNPTRSMAFAQELYSLAKRGDALMGISTSGNAQNVIYAAATAKALGLTVIALTGRDGGKLAEISDVAIKAPASETSRVQEMHSAIYHTLCRMLEASLLRRLELNERAETL
jgi:phosphoheptose isomerase